MNISVANNKYFPQDFDFSNPPFIPFCLMIPADLYLMPFPARLNGTLLFDQPR